MATDTSKISGLKSGPAHGNRAAFSLVEVTLALGIVTRCVYIGIRPASDRAEHVPPGDPCCVESRMLRRCSAMSSRRNSTTLIQSGSGTVELFSLQLGAGRHNLQSLARYFDDQGGEVVPAAPYAERRRETKSALLGQRMYPRNSVAGRHEHRELHESGNGDHPGGE